MKLPEKIILGFILFTVVLKLFHFPGASFVIAFCSILSMYYMVAAFWAFSYSDKKNGIKENNIGFSIPVGIFMAIAVIGILFRWMFWPGASINLLFSGVVLTGFMISSFILSSRSQKKNYFRVMSIRLSIITFLTLALYFTGSKKLYGFLHSDDPELVRLYGRMIDDPENFDKVMEFENYKNGDTLR